MRRVELLARGFDFALRGEPLGDEAAAHLHGEDGELFALPSGDDALLRLADSIEGDLNARLRGGDGVGLGFLQADEPVIVSFDAVDGVSATLVQKAALFADAIEDARVVVHEFDDQVACFDLGSFGDVPLHDAAFNGRGNGLLALQRCRRGKFARAGHALLSRREDER